MKNMNCPFYTHILPKKIEDIEMKTLVVAVGSSVVQLLDKIKKHSGSNANPVSLQAIKSGEAINKKLKKNLELKGKSALRAFFQETDKHFDASFGVFRSITKKYNLCLDTYSKKVCL